MGKIIFLKLLNRCLCVVRDLMLIRLMGPEFIPVSFFLFKNKAYEHDSILLSVNSFFVPLCSQKIS